MAEKTKVENVSQSKNDSKSKNLKNTKIDAENEKQNNTNKDAHKTKISEEKNNFDKDISKPYINNSKPVIELVACLSYLLFFLPLIFCRKEPFALYHANQSLILWLFASVFYLAFGFIPNVNIIALPIIVIFHIIAIFYGMYNSAHGRARPIPLIGKITIIKWN